MRKFVTSFSLLAAPGLYLLGRLAGRSDVSARSVHLDPQYLRGYASMLSANNITSELFHRFAQAAKICASAHSSVDEEIIRLFPNSHGQLLQDVICALLHQRKRGGYFVEVGVGDGTRYSNTLMLERDFGWKGILAEPASMFHEHIAKSRTAILDPRAVSDQTGKTLLFEQDDMMGELSGISGTRTPRGRQTLSTYEVKTVRLDDLLSEHGAPDEIDYISIDTEGSELSVLSGLSLAKRRIWLFTIEHNYDMKKIRSYADILGAAGYRKILPSVSSFDSWFVHTDLESDLF